MSFEVLQEKAKKEWEEFNSFRRLRILIGAATCGRASGALNIKRLIEEGVSSEGVEADIYEVGCLGICYAEPLVEIGFPDGRRILFDDVTEEKAEQLINDVIIKGKPRADLALCRFGDTTVDGLPHFSELPMVAGQVRIVLRNAGIIDPTNFYHYVARGGYSGLARALKMTQEEVIEEVLKSGLRGRGGAGFPTGRKWNFAFKAKSDKKFIVCNADEGDPGAFMDRAVLESDPHAVLEGLLIAAYAIGADEGYIYIRAEYPLAVERLKIAIEQLKEAGLLGRDIMGSGFDFTVKIKEGAGAFVCGEETALIASIEGYRGMPRSRPPFPAIKGLWGKPTIINNVETLANVSAILKEGAEWFAQFGTEKSRGTKTFALAGKVKRTGLIEVPMGIRLRDIIYKIGGGILNDKKFKAVQTGGPSGGCLGEEHLDLPVDYESLAGAGAIMGSGGMIVMDEDTCIVDIARYFLEFTRKESCGKCTPCRMGSQHLLRILTEITEGRGTEKHLEVLERVAVTVKSGSLCGLGQTLPNPVLTTIRYFRDEYEKHIKDKKCPAGVCKALFEYRIDEEKCKACGKCKKECPVEAIEGEKKTPHRIVQERCVKCGSCYDVCPFDAVVKV